MKNSTKHVSENKMINCEDAIGYDLRLVGQRGKIPTVVVILALLFFFPLGLILCVVNVCSKNMVYGFTVYKKDHQVFKRVVGEFKYLRTLENMKRWNIPQVKEY